MDESAALFTDLYEFTMVDGYLQEDMHDEAVFSLFVRRLPSRRNFLVACGLAMAFRGGSKGQRAPSRPRPRG